MEERKMRPRPRRSRRKVCKFCVEKATGIDYKDIKKLTGIDSRPFSTAPFSGRALFFCRNQKSMATLFIIYWLFLFRPRGIMGG